MRKYFLFFLTILLGLTATSQIFQKDDIVEVDPLLSDSVEGKWKQATIVDYDSTAKKYTVKLADGNKMTVPSKDPENWIRPFVDRNKLIKYGPSERIAYEKRERALKPIKCNASEMSIKRNIKSLMAAQYKDYSYIFVDFTSFKGQHGYDDKKHARQQVYPYKIEMLVHLKRTLMMGGRMYTEYQTWEFDREYEYASRAGKKCEFYPLGTTGVKLVSKGWY